MTMCVVDTTATEEASKRLTDACLAFDDTGSLLAQSRLSRDVR
jgi:hypothetical protein